MYSAPAITAGVEKGINDEQKRGKCRFQKENRNVKKSETIREEQDAERGAFTGSK